MNLDKRKDGESVLKSNRCSESEVSFIFYRLPGFQLGWSWSKSTVLRPDSGVLMHPRPLSSHYISHSITPLPSLVNCTFWEETEYDPSLFYSSWVHSHSSPGSLIWPPTWPSASALSLCSHIVLHIFEYHLKNCTIIDYTPTLLYPSSLLDIDLLIG